MDKDNGKDNEQSTWHIVLFKFKQSITQQEIDRVNAAFHALKDSTRNGRPYIKRIVSGAQNSIEGAAKGYTLGFIVEFDNEDDRDFYVGKPFVKTDEFDHKHDAFKQLVAPLLAEKDGVLVFDFTCRN